MQLLKSYAAVKNLCCSLGLVSYIAMGSTAHAGCLEAGLEKARGALKTLREFSAALRKTDLRSAQWRLVEDYQEALRAEIIKARALAKAPGVPTTEVREDVLLRWEEECLAEADATKKQSKLIAIAQERFLSNRAVSGAFGRSGGTVKFSRRLKKMMSPQATKEELAEAMFEIEVMMRGNEPTFKYFKPIKELSFKDPILLKSWSAFAKEMTEQTEVRRAALGEMLKESSGRVRPEVVEKFMKQGALQTITERVAAVAKTRRLDVLKLSAEELAKDPELHREILQLAYEWRYFLGPVVTGLGFVAGQAAVNIAAGKARDAGHEAMKVEHQDQTQKYEDCIEEKNDEAAGDAELAKKLRAECYRKFIDNTQPLEVEMKQIESEIEN